MPLKAAFSRSDAHSKKKQAIHWERDLAEWGANATASRRLVPEMDFSPVEVETVLPKVRTQCKGEKRAESNRRTAEDEERPKDKHRKCSSKRGQKLRYSAAVEQTAHVRRVPAKAEVHLFFSNDKSERRMSRASMERHGTTPLVEEVKIPTFAEIKHFKLARSHRSKAMRAKRIEQLLALHRPFERSPNEIAEIAALLPDVSPLFSEQSLGVQRHVSAAGWLECYGAHEDILKRGEQATCFYIILSGMCHVVLPSQGTDGAGEAVSSSGIVARLRQGESFGELSLLSETATTRTSTIQAATNTSLIVLSKADFLHSLGSMFHDESSSFRHWLMVHCPHAFAETKNVQSCSLRFFANAKQVECAPGTTLKPEERHSVLFLKSGECNMYIQTANSGRQYVAEMGIGDTLGLTILLEDVQHDWIAHSPTGATFFRVSSDLVLSELSNSVKRALKEKLLFQTTYLVRRADERPAVLRAATSMGMYSDDEDRSEDVNIALFSTDARAFSPNRSMSSTLEKIEKNEYANPHDSDIGTAVYPRRGVNSELPQLADSDAKSKRQRLINEVLERRCLSTGSALVR